MRECVQVGGCANTLKRVHLVSSSRPPSLRPLTRCVNELRGSRAALAVGIVTVLALATSRAMYSCGTTTRGSSWMLKQRSMSGRYLRKACIMPCVASRCQSPPPSMFLTFWSRTCMAISELPNPSASLARARIVAGLRPQKGVISSWIVSNSSISCTSFLRANSYHLSKLGGGGMPYRRRYSLTASWRLRDCRDLILSRSRSASLIRCHMGCEPAGAALGVCLGRPAASSLVVAGGTYDGGRVSSRVVGRRGLDWRLVRE